MPSMALILLVKVQSRVFTAKCSEPQADASNGMGEGSCVGIQVGVLLMMDVIKKCKAVAK